jgi:SOS-response transcriptional repressor LexA
VGDSTICGIEQHNSFLVNTTACVENAPVDGKTLKTPGERIRAARIAKGLTQAQLGAACGWGDSQSRVGNYERGEREPAGSDYIAMAKVLSVTPAYLQFGEEMVEPGPDVQAMVPLISWIQAGDFAEVSDPHPPGAADEWYPYAKRRAGTFVALRVRGDSMTAPYGKTYPDGSVIFVNLELRSPANGQRVVAKLEGEQEATFKVFVEDAGRRWLKPLNPQHPPLLQPFQIVGTVVGKWEEE